MCEFEILKQPPRFQYIDKMVKTMQAFLKDIHIWLLLKIKFTNVCYHTWAADLLIDPRTYWSSSVISVRVYSSRKTIFFIRK